MKSVILELSGRFFNLVSLVDIYTAIRTTGRTLMDADAVCRLLFSLRSNRLMLLGFLVQLATSTFFKPLTDEKREKVVIWMRRQ